MEWQPIETAPKGSFEKVRAGKDGLRQIHRPVKILAPTSCGQITITSWIESAERWNMFSKDHPPTHWMPLPAPPEV